ncbi:sortase, partial [Ruminococcaceae bacterium OttesenSCG-928-D13]|nr:sortase [Ruminococcaceae bacterium OttesenSCG-928-D13]
MIRMSKKARIIATVIVAVIVCAMFVVGYLTKHKDDAPPPQAPASESAPQIVGGPLLDEPPSETWEDDEATGYNGFTTRAQLGAKEGSIGVLTIEKIGVSVHVFDSDEGSTVEDMKKGAAHYRTTSYWDGNIGMAAHIGNASYSYFERLRELKVGDTLTYETELGTRTYAVAKIATISDTDWSYLDRTEDNRLTLTTCIE